MTKRLFAVLVALLAFAPAANSQDAPVALKISHWVPATHPVHKAVEEWLAGVTKASGGTITGTIFPAQQLGKAFDHYNMARDGIAEMTYVNPGYEPGRFPVIAAGELPFLMSEPKGGSQALDEWYRKYAAAEMKDVHYCFAFVHDPGAIHSRKKIVVPEDLKGMKVRPADATIASLVTRLGGTNVQASAPEVRDLLEKGVADAVTFPWGSLISFGADKAVKFHMDAPLYTTTFVWVLNKDAYAGMSAAQKKVIDDACSPIAAARTGEIWAAFEQSGHEKLRAATGREVYALTPEQLALWKSAAEPLTAKWAEDAKKTGIDSAAALVDLKAALTAHGAGY